MLTIVLNNFDDDTEKEQEKIMPKIGISDLGSEHDETQNKEELNENEGVLEEPNLEDEHSSH